MVRSHKGSEWCHTGGILSLAGFINEHYKAVETDLLGCGYEVEDVGRSLSWGALLSFISNVGINSAIAKDLNPDLSMWSTAFKTNAILADIYDVLALINANLVAIGSHHNTKTPKRYPRPFGDMDDGTQHIGSGAIPVDELKSMFASKRKR